MAEGQHRDGDLMPLLARRGYTLIELLIALVLLGMVSGAIYKVLVNNQRLYLAQTQQIDLQQNMRAAAAILPAEFRELDAADGDIRAMSATSITIRAMRLDRKSTRLNSSHVAISYAVFCLKKKTK